MGVVDRRRMLKKLHWLLVGALSVFITTSEIYGQSSTAPPAQTEGWRIQFAPFLWVSGFKGRVGILDRSIQAKASFGDILDNLDAGFMGLLETNRGRFVAATDLVYIKLSDTSATPGPLFSNVESVDKTFISTSRIGYRVVGSDAAFIDALGGIRVWDLSSELHLESGALPAINLQGDRTWEDGIGALRGKMKLSPTWAIYGYGDIGGGGSNLTYQLLGVATASIRDHAGFAFGYRYLKVNYNKDRFLFDSSMGGPVVGLYFNY